MAREFPIHNGRMTTDLDANGHRIKNLPPGSGFTQVQSDWNQSDATAPDFIKNKPTIPVVPSLAAVATSGSYNDLTDKPTIPAPVSVDATLTTQGAAADAKAVGDALRSGFTEWICEPPTYNGRAVEVKPFNSQLLMNFWRLQYVSDDGVIAIIPMNVDDDRLELDFEDVGVTATRHAFPPTKTSQLENDGDGTNAFVKTNDTRLSDARTPTAHAHAIADVTGLGAALAQKASLTDLPYRLVEPGKWEFSDGGSHTINGPNEDQDGWVYQDGVTNYYSQFFDTEADALAALSLTFTDGALYVFTATRPSLPGHLIDRAGNRVVVSGDTVLTLPAANPGYLRDFLVRLEISGSTLPTITFAAPTGETIVYETDGDDFPVTDEAGTWLYAFTETDASTFAVALKSVTTVAQGGS